MWASILRCSMLQGFLSGLRPYGATFLTSVGGSWKQCSAASAVLPRGLISTYVSEALRSNVGKANLLETGRRSSRETDQHAATEIQWFPKSSHCEICVSCWVARPFQPRGYGIATSGIVSGTCVALVLGLGSKVE